MIVVAGESLVDLLVRPDGSVEATPGGGPYNVARALARLGVAVAFVGRLSNDRFGRILRARLVADGVDLRWIRSTDDPTLLAVAELDEDRAATYRFHSAGTAAPGFVASDLPGGLPAETTAFHIGTLGIVLEPIATTIEGLVARAADDVLVALDLNCRPAAIREVRAYRARLDRLYERVDLVKASTDDLHWLERGVDAEETARSIVGRGPAAVLLTDGAGPVRVITSHARESVPVPPVDVVDSVGSGDAFGAGFLASWVEAGRGRRDLTDITAVLEATRFAVRVGALTATRAGADPPTRAELGLPSPAGVVG